MEASLAHERAALQHVQELEARVAAFDSKEKATLRVGRRQLVGAGLGWVGGRFSLGMRMMDGWDAHP